MLLHRLDEVGQLLHEVGHLLYEVGQLLYEVSQQIFADSHQGVWQVGVDLQLESIKALCFSSLQPALINGCRCYEMKIDESEKASSHRESNPGHLWLKPPVLCHVLSHNSRTTTSPHNPLYVLHKW